MKFISICMHCLDMRDFHSKLRNTPFLDILKKRSIYIPMGRAQGHHQSDSLTAEFTGMWSSKFTNSELTTEGFKRPTDYFFPKTILESIKEEEIDIFTDIGDRSAAVYAGLPEFWLKDGDRERMKQFFCPGGKREIIISKLRESENFYAHFHLRETHRPWAHGDELLEIAGLVEDAKLAERRNENFLLDNYWILAARRLPLDAPLEFSAIRRKGLQKADQIIKEIINSTSDLGDVHYLIYSNHGEMFDFHKYQYRYEATKFHNVDTIYGTTHGSMPYEAQYANMQMWIIPGLEPKMVRGIGRSH